MKKYEIHLSDWQRIVFGTAPASFMIEIIFRTILTYLVLIFIMRLMGKRMSAKLNITEVAVMITLGGIVSVPMQVPERGILQGLTVLVCALFFERGVNKLGVKNSRIEKMIHGDVSLLVSDGIMLRKNMEAAHISPNQLFAKLRGRNIWQLGMLERVYLEGSGSLSVFKFSAERPGLAVLPPEDRDIYRLVEPTNDDVCNYCGHTGANLREKTCTSCGKQDWRKAVKKKQLQHG